MPKTVDTVPQPPLLIKQKQTLLVIAILLVLLPISIWAVNQMTAKPPKAANLPLGSVRINPEQIVTDLGGTTIYLSALAYDTGGSPISSGISYQWGFSTTNSIGIFSPNGTTNLSSFKPSTTIKGRGDIWVKAFGANGQTATKSIPVYVGVVPEITLLDSVRINPEKIDTVRNAPSIQLSALAYKNGVPVWDGISYEWGISTINSIGQLILNSNTKLASFEPSHMATGSGDIWVRASDESGHIAIRSIPVIVGYPIISPTPTPNPIPVHSIKVLQPNGNETLIEGQKYTVTWDMSNVVAAEVYLTTDTNYVITKLPLVSPYSNTSLTWYVSRYGYTIPKYKIKLVGHRENFLPDLIDYSDNTFAIITPTPIPTSIPQPTATPIPTPTPIVCLPADINRDGTVNMNDRNTLLTYYLTTGPILKRTDINNDGVVDITDYSILVANFGKTTGVCQ